MKRHWLTIVVVMSLIECGLSWSQEVTTTSMHGDYESAGQAGQFYRHGE